MRGLLSTILNNYLVSAQDRETDEETWVNDVCVLSRV